MSTTTVADPAVSGVSNLSVLLTKHVQEQPNRTAVGTSDLRTVISYSQLDALIRSAMAQLSRLGLRPGDTVALISDNCVEFVVGLLAVVSSGACVAPLNPDLTLSELGARLSELSAYAALTPKHLANKLEFKSSIEAGAARLVMSIESE